MLNVLKQLIRISLFKFCKIMIIKLLITTDIKFSKNYLNHFWICSDLFIYSNFIQLKLQVKFKMVKIKIFV
jgi:hypothetical protein